MDFREEDTALELVALRRELSEPAFYLTATLRAIRRCLEAPADDTRARAALGTVLRAAEDAAHEIVEIARHIAAADFEEPATQHDLATFVRQTMRLVEPELARRAHVVIDVEYEPRVIAATRALRHVILAALSHCLLSIDPDAEDRPRIVVAIQRGGRASAVLSVRSDPVRNEHTALSPRGARALNGTLVVKQRGGSADVRVFLPLAASSD